MELSADDPGIMSYTMGGSSDPAPPRMENPNPSLALRFNFTYLEDFSSMTEIVTQIYMISSTKNISIVTFYNEISI